MSVALRSKYSGYIEKCGRVPSKGGIPSAEVRRLAKEMGIPTKGYKKAAICDAILEKSGYLGGQIIPPTKSRPHPQSQSQLEPVYKIDKNLMILDQSDDSIGHIPDKILEMLLLDMDSADTKELCLISDRVRNLCLGNNDIVKKLQSN